MNKIIIAEANLPQIKSLDEIKVNGFYRLNESIVEASCFGLPSFSSCQMPPITIHKEGGCIQFFIDKHGVPYCRAGVYANGPTNWHCWINIDEVNQRLEEHKLLAKKGKRHGK